MKTLQQLFAAILLALALGITAYAGDVEGPSGAKSPAPLSTGCIPAVTATQAPTLPGETGSTALTELAFFLMSALSMY